MSPRGLRRWRWLLVGGLALALAGCGWHAGLGPASEPLALADTEGRPTSVGVALFGLSPRVLEPDLEPLLHREVSRAVSDLVAAPLRTAEQADLVVEGTIVEFRRRGGIRDEQHDLLETGVRFAAHAELVERASGRVLATADAHIWSSYTVGNRDPVSGDIRSIPSSEDEALDRALRHVAETLVLDLFRAPTRTPENSGDGAG